MGEKCSKFTKNVKRKCPCFQKDNVEIINNEINTNNPSQNNTESQNISRKESFQMQKNNTEKNRINENENKRIFPYFTQEEMIKINKILQKEKKQIKNSSKIKIRHYKLGNIIGEGSYGRVYEALDEDRGQLIAVKIIDKNNLNTINNSNNNSQSLSSIEGEIEILSKLNHKNIVKYYDSSQSKNHLKIFFEYCECGSIAKMLSNYKSFNEKIIRKYTKEMLEGLEYLHAHSIIHRDIKGANILVDRNGICKLSDFGGAKIIKEDFEKTSTMRGTPNWMAPEVIKYNENTRFSDIWSVGCTVIEMINGEPPFSNIKNPFKVLFHIINCKEPPQIPKNCSFNLQHFIYSCLKINPWERLNVCQLLTHPFIIGDLNYSNFSDFHSKNSADTDILSRSKNGEKNNKQLNNRNFDKTENDIFGYKK
jgi:mitogen-activated protein kinase kinase kinase 3